MEPKCRITLMISAIIKKPIQGEHQNQKTITTNINYLQNSVNLKTLQKLKISSDKTETRQNNFYVYRKDVRPLHKKAR